MSLGLDDIIGNALSGPERARLVSMHELLLRAGPPPVLPKRLQAPPAFRRFRRPTPAAAFAVVAAVALGVVSGYQLRAQLHAPEPVTTIHLHPTSAAPATARATLRVGRADSSGNRNLTLVVAHLPPSRQPTYYELDLTRDRRPAASCGRFELASTRATVFLNEPYALDRFDGWAVVREREGTVAPKALVVLHT